MLLLAICAGCARPAGQQPTAADASKESGAAEKGVGGLRPVRVSAEGLSAAEPSVATGPDGVVYVAWVAHGAGKEADVWLTRFDAEGKQAGEPARINQTPGEATAWRGDVPRVAAGPNGTVYVSWTARAAEGRHGTTLNVSASRDGGKSFGAPVKVNDDAGEGEHGLHSLAVGRDGRVHVAWLDERDLAPGGGAMKDGKDMEAKKASRGVHGESNREVFYASSSDGGKTFSRNVRVASEACPCCKTSLAVSEDGHVYLAWRQVLPGDLRHIAVASSSDGGQTFGTPAIVSDDRWELSGCPVSGPALAAGDNGSLRVLWFTAGEAGAPGLYTAESADGGRTFAPRRVVMEGGVRGTPALVADGRGGFVAVFDGGGAAGSQGLSMARLDATTNAPTSIIAGELPTAAARGQRLYTAYVSKGGVWLVDVE